MPLRPTHSHFLSHTILSVFWDFSIKNKLFNILTVSVKKEMVARHSGVILIPELWGEGRGRQISVNSRPYRAAETAQQLSILAVLPKDSGLNPRTTCWLAPVTPAPEALTPSAGLQRNYMHKHTQNKSWGKKQCSSCTPVQHHIQCPVSWRCEVLYSTAALLCRVLVRAALHRLCALWVPRDLRG